MKTILIKQVNITRHLASVNLTTTQMHVQNNLSKYKATLVHVS